YFRVGYGESLRHFLAVNGHVRLLIDFGDTAVFTAVAYPSIILVRKTRETRDKGSLTPASKDTAKFQKLVPDGALTRALSWEAGPPIEEFPSILTDRGFGLPQRELKPDGWRLESPAGLRFLDHLREKGKPLREFVGQRIYRGI